MNNERRYRALLQGLDITDLLFLLAHIYYLKARAKWRHFLMDWRMK